MVHKTYAVHTCKYRKVLKNILVASGHFFAKKSTLRALLCINDFMLLAYIEVHSGFRWGLQKWVCTSTEGGPNNNRTLFVFVSSCTPKMGENYRSRALKSRSKLRAAIGLRAALGNFLLHQNSSLFTVTFEGKVPTLAKSRSS